MNQSGIINDLLSKVGYNIVNYLVTRIKTVGKRKKLDKTKSKRRHNSTAKTMGFLTAMQREFFFFIYERLSDAGSVGAEDCQGFVKYQASAGQKTSKQQLQAWLDTFRTLDLLHGVGRKRYILNNKAGGLLEDELWFQELQGDVSHSPRPVSVLHAQEMPSAISGVAQKNSLTTRRGATKPVSQKQTTRLTQNNASCFAERHKKAGVFAGLKLKLPTSPQAMAVASGSISYPVEIDVAELSPSTSSASNGDLSSSGRGVSITPQSEKYYTPVGTPEAAINPTSTQQGEAFFTPQQDGREVARKIETKTESSMPCIDPNKPLMRQIPVLALHMKQRYGSSFFTHNIFSIASTNKPKSFEPPPASPTI